MHSMQLYVQPSTQYSDLNSAIYCYNIYSVLRPTIAAQSELVHSTQASIYTQPETWNRKTQNSLYFKSPQALAKSLEAVFAFKNQKSIILKGAFLYKLWSDYSESFLSADL
jgi:hypothetical protein